MCILKSYKVFDITQNVFNNAYKCFFFSISDCFERYPAMQHKQLVKLTLTIKN
jgi:hypothetical protein